MNPEDVKDLDAIMRVLGQRRHRETLALRLFPHSTEDYLREWVDRGPFEFWCHLDASNRLRVMQLAPLTYEEANPKSREVVVAPSPEEAKRFFSFDEARGYAIRNPLIGWPAWRVEELCLGGARAFLIALRPAGPYLKEVR